MGPAPDSGIDHTPGKEDFTENWIHESQTSIPRNRAFKKTSKSTTLDGGKKRDFLFRTESDRSLRHGKNFQLWRRE